MEGGGKRTDENGNAIETETACRVGTPSRAAPPAVEERGTVELRGPPFAFGRLNCRWCETREAEKGRAMGESGAAQL